MKAQEQLERVRGGAECRTMIHESNSIIGQGITGTSVFARNRNLLLEQRVN